MPRLRGIWFIALGAALALAVLTFVAPRVPGPWNAPIRAVPEPPLIPAESAPPAPPFHLATFEGTSESTSLALSDLRGKTIVLNFWASWCTPCKQEMPNLERVWQEFRHQGVVVVGVDVQDDLEEAEAFLKALGITYPNVFDAGPATMTAYQVTGLPTTFFVDAGGLIRARVTGGYFGEPGRQDLRRQIAALLNGSP